MAKIRKARDFYYELQRKMPSDEWEALKKPNRFYLEIPGVLPGKESSPLEILETAEELVEAMRESLC